MKVIITFTFSCSNLWKSRFVALENSENFSPTLWPHYLFLFAFNALLLVPPVGE